MAEALIRHDLLSDKTYIGGNKSHRFFVSVDDEDPSGDAIQRLSDTGVKFFPGSKWQQGEDMRLGIDAPELAVDGTYVVRYSCFCGMMCRSVNSAVMSRDGAKWHVLKSEIVEISAIKRDRSLR
jgi:hypothetical protein